MVKRQKEKQYQSAREHRENAQIRSGAVSHSQTQQVLPFSCCALSLTPFATPMCTVYSIKNEKDGKKMHVGMIFDDSSILPFVKKHGKDPVTGEPLAVRDIITLHMDATDAQDAKNRHDTRRWQCPVLNKPFSDRHSKIVAVRDRETNSAYVYSYEAYHELNVKPKSYVDLTTGKPFQPKKDVLVLFDPENKELNSRREISNFWHIQHKRGLSASAVNMDGSRTNQIPSNVKHSVTANRIMEQLQREKAEKEVLSRKRSAVTLEKENEDELDSKKLKIYADDVTGVAYTSAQAATSLTSTSMSYSQNGQNATRLATDEEILQSQFRVMRQRRQKGYVQLETNMGILLLELHCDIAPRTCTNFLGLAARGAYNNTLFHRLIPKFMMQGGSKPADKEKKEDDSSFWGDAFRDEFDDRLKHTGKGVVSMANAGSNTNKRQFFITFRSCPHLDRKHSVFGQIVEGQDDILARMEACNVDQKDRPVQSIILLRTNILTDPAKEAQDLEKERITERHRQKKIDDARKSGSAKISKSKQKKPEEKNRIGKYLSPSTPSLPKQATALDSEKEGLILPMTPKISSKKPAPSKTKFSDFSGW